MKKWFFGLYQSDIKGHRHTQIIEFANRNDLVPGEIVVLNDDADTNTLAFMYHSTRELT